MPLFISLVHTSSVEPWGFVQFPALTRLVDGRIGLSFQVARDSALSYGKESFRYFVSTDGIEWKEERFYPILSVETLEAKKASGKPITYIPYGYARQELSPAYRIDDPRIAIRRGARVDLAPIELFDDVRVETEGVVPLIFFGPLKKLPSGDLLGIFYPSYTSTDSKCGILLVRSQDLGKSWRQIDRLPYLYDRAGYTEPAAEVLSDGTLFLVLRTADGLLGPAEKGPLYSVKRSPEGRWSTPRVINPYGVSPQLLKLKNGLLVLSYGRPGVEVRVSDDEGETWSDPIFILEPIPETPRQNTCGYTSLLEDPNNPDAFYLAYSHFTKDQKTILVQKLKF